MDFIEQAVKEIKEKIGKELDLENETYLLQTPSAYMQIGLEEEDDGERKLNVQVTGGNITCLKTEKDIFKDLYLNDDENDN
ncbi:hypothetical protein [Staphylococcus haemolyticus]|uniref:hypothetical protein n=1 Tax=Staphylococcus haemolyticus TaxID=1283 RepID=UPI001F0A8406|nr:hypothetical protein [Staphylococcus haemolyticus]MCH4489307.1 hypothetical protein [Staphylococcus haemolyticus]